MARRWTRGFTSAVVLTMLVLTVAPATAGAQTAGPDDPESPDCVDTGDTATKDSPTSKKKNNAKRAAAQADPDDDAANGADNSAGDACEPEEPPPPPVSLANLRSPAPAATDLELQAALANVGFLDTWYSLTPTHPRLSLIVTAGPATIATRTALLERVDTLVDTRESTTVLLNVTQDAVGRRRAVERKITMVDDQLTTLNAQRLTAQETLGTLEGQLTTVLDALTGAAVGMYVNDEQLTVAGIDDVGSYNDQQELAERVDATIDELLSQRDVLDTRISTQNQRLADLDRTIGQRQAERTDLVVDQEGLTDTIDLLTQEITELTSLRIALEAELPSAITDAQTARLEAAAPAVDFSMVALDAYVQAAEQITDSYPACAIRWEVLAGIASVESRHGTFGGAVVGSDGVVSKRILGPLLDGTLEDTKVITDSDGGRLDGNAEFDAAVGPFQFIPSTWSRSGLDGDGDGVADPHNMYDAALSAAGYLCTASDLGNDAQIARSVLSYNNSGFYLADVTGIARDNIIGLALPEAAYDPESLAPTDGWNLDTGPGDEWEEIGHIGREGSRIDEPFVFDPGVIKNTGD